MMLLHTLNQYIEILLNLVVNVVWMIVQLSSVDAVQIKSMSAVVHASKTLLVAHQSVVASNVTIQMAKDQQCYMKNKHENVNTMNYNQFTFTTHHFWCKERRTWQKVIGHSWKTFCLPRSWTIYNLKKKTSHQKMFTEYIYLEIIKFANDYNVRLSIRPKSMSSIVFKMEQHTKLKHLISVALYTSWNTRFRIPFCILGQPLSDFFVK